MDHVSGYEGQVRLAGRGVGSQGKVRYVCQWATSSRDTGSPHTLCKDPSATRRSQQEFCYSFQSVQPTVMYLQRQMTLGKLIL